MQQRPASAGPPSATSSNHHPIPYRRSRNRSDPLTSSSIRSTSTLALSGTDSYNEKQQQPIFSSNFPILSVQHLRPIIVNGPEDLAKDQFYFGHFNLTLSNNNNNKMTTTGETNSNNDQEKDQVEIQKQEEPAIEKDLEEGKAENVLLKNEPENPPVVVEESPQILQAIKNPETITLFRKIEENIANQCRMMDDFGHKMTFEQQKRHYGPKPRLWDPVKTAAAPTEDEFQMAELAFGRFIHFNKNRLAVGLSAEAVRLLTRYYSNLEDEQFKEVSTIPSRPEAAGARADIRKSLENRHLSVLTNLLMMTVETEQKQQQSLEQFCELLEENPFADDQESTIESVDSSLKNDILALSQEHTRLRAAYFSEIRAARALMVSSLKSSHRILAKLRRRSRASMARKILRQSLQKPLS